MDRNAKIYVAGHRGLVGSAVMRELRRQGYRQPIVRTHAELDLTNQEATERFFEAERPEYVFLVAAKVGGIWANNTYRADFLYQNLLIGAHVVHAAWRHGVRKLLNLGSSCIYPKLAPQPMREDHLLTGPLESTNEPYALAKIATLKLCRAYNDQYGTDFLSLMPTNLYGPGDNYDLHGSHVLPAMLRKFHLAKLRHQNDMNAIMRNLGCRDAEEMESVLASIGVGGRGEYVTLWGTGSPRREFLHVDDLAAACVFLMERCSAADIGETINVGCGADQTIRELADMVREAVGYEGEIRWDSSKPDGTPQKLLDISRISKLGWQPTISLPEGIRATYREYADKSP